MTAFKGCSVTFYNVETYLFKRIDISLSKLKKKPSENNTLIYICSLRSSHQEVFLEKGVQKICTKFTGEHS